MNIHNEVFIDGPTKFSIEDIRLVKVSDKYVFYVGRIWKNYQSYKYDKLSDSQKSKFIEFIDIMNMFLPVIEKYGIKLNINKVTICKQDDKSLSNVIFIDENNNVDISYTGSADTIVKRCMSDMQADSDGKYMIIVKNNMIAINNVKRKNEIYYPKDFDVSFEKEVRFNHNIFVTDAALYSFESLPHIARYANDIYIYCLTPRSLLINFLIHFEIFKDISSFLIKNNYDLLKYI